jgi:pimeloyl-ACP methyl ester carboxylesterase
MRPTIKPWGWYDDARGTVLLTQFPEDYFGEPMILLAEGDAISRVDPGSLPQMTASGELTLEKRRLPRSSRFVESETTFTAGGVTLAATVIRPSGDEPFPGAVIVHGAAGGQRDWCRIQAEPLLAAGVAVLIYDKAGHGESGGEAPGIYEQAEAVEAAVETLAAVPGIDPGMVGLAGLSNGMWAVPMVAARHPVAFITGVGSPGVTMAESEVHRRVKLLRESGVGPGTLKAVAKAWRSIFSIVAQGRTATAVADLLEATATLATAEDLGLYDVPTHVVQNPMISPIPPQIPADDLVAMLSVERDPQLSYDPAADYARISCPIFLQYGADDTSVPVEASVAAVSHAAPHADIRVYPGLEHLLNVVPPLAPGEDVESVMYSYRDFRTGTGVRAELTQWVQETILQRAIQLGHEPRDRDEAGKVFHRPRHQP